MKIALTGATGFIGSHLSEALKNKGYDVYHIVRTESYKESSKTNIILYDCSAPESLLKDFKEHKFLGVIHIASMVSVSHSYENINSLILSNITFGTHLLEACKASNVSWFINTGTFWQNYQDAPYSPVNLYAATKEAMQTIARYYTETSDLVFCTIKLNDTYGENDTRSKIFNLWHKIALSGEKLDMSAGEQIIDISYIDDVVNAYILLTEQLCSSEINKFKNRTFAVSNRERTSLRNMAKIFENALGCKLNINWGSRPYREREVMLPWQSGEKVPGWTQQFSLEEGIKKTFGRQ